MSAMRCAMDWFSPDRTPELAALSRERDGGSEVALHGPQVRREQASALPGHRCLKNRHSLALLAQAARRRDATVLEVDLPGGGGVKAHFAERTTDDEPRRLPFHGEGRQPEETSRGARRCIDEEQVGDRAVGDVALRSVEDVVVAVAGGFVFTAATSDPASAS